ncbi:MAG: lipase [Solirubrobacterales bacterium]|nr:lipase [Solirubrobacterales bacterium]
MSRLPVVRRAVTVTCLTVVACLSAGVASAAAAGTPVFAPVTAPGPALSVPVAKLDAALLCSPSLAKTTKAPVLLVQGTGASAKDNWSWTYEPALDKLGIAWCAVDLPEHATADVQVAGEYVVHAIRTMHAKAGRRIAIIGHSQGGMVPRWALRFWPDTRPMVDDLIGFAPSNHGTTLAGPSCGGSCSAANWQQADTSNFMKALNSFQETFKGTSYTNIYTRTDEVVQPNKDAKTGSSSLRTGDGAITNVATQDVCPTDAYEHLTIGLLDPVAYALAVDALTHDGPADPKRVPLTTCAQVYQPGINLATVVQDSSAALISYEGYQPKTYPSEPALACYTTASCAVTAASCTSRRRFTVHVPQLRGVTVTLGGRALRLQRKSGRLVVTVDLRGRKAGTVVLKIRGRTSSGRTVTQTRTYRTCG